jgi:colanic acid/amylovoran biosynthesis glycosyltransferase
MHSPHRYFTGIALALRVRPPGLKALLRQIAYFMEAALVAGRMRAHDLIHLHNHFANSSCSVAMLAAAMGGFSFSFTMHGPAEFFEPHYWRVDEKIRRARFVCCISHFCRSQAMIFAPRAKWDRMHIVHCGIDPNEYPPRVHQGRGKRLLFVGRLAAAKGLPVLIEALSIVRKRFFDVELTIAGDGPDRQELQSMAQRLEIGNAIRFLGYQSQAQVRGLLAETDVFAMASFAEGVPVVLMEAMAAGVPVVATRIAGVPELVDDGISGLLVPPGDVASLALGIERLLQDAALRNRFAVSGRQKVAVEFNTETESRRLCQILTGALGGQVAPVRPDAPARLDAVNTDHASPGDARSEEPVVAAGG